MKPQIKVPIVVLTTGFYLLSGSIGQAEPLFESPEEAIPWTVDVGSQKQLFLDDRLIAEVSNVSPFMVRPEKYQYNPVLKAEQPWEQGAYKGSHGLQLAWQSVLYDDEEKVFKMWYLPWVWEKQTQEIGRETRPWCYAVSKDGYQWERPNLGLVEFEGSRENNIIAVMADETYTSVIKTPHDPDPQRLYKAFGELEPKGKMEKHGACVAFSPDGIHWTAYPDNPVIKKGPDFSDGSNILGWDPRIQKYVAYLRPGRPWDAPTHHRVLLRAYPKRV